jgi:hypothetical protein
MGFENLIKRMQKQRSALDEVIDSLEATRSQMEARAPAETQAAAAKKRRGRKSMSMEERQVVGERMKKYWARRRQAKLAPDRRRGD